MRPAFLQFGEDFEAVMRAVLQPDIENDEIGWLFTDARIGFGGVRRLPGRIAFVP